MRSTTDIWFATFLKMEGYSVVNFEVLGLNKGKFFFEITDEGWKDMKMKCDKSIISKVKTAQTSLRDLLY